MVVTYALHEKEATEKKLEENTTSIKQISRSKGQLAGFFLVFE